MIKIVLASGLMVALQGFGMNPNPNQGGKPEGVYVSQEEYQQLMAMRREKSVHDTRARLHESALEFYNAHLGKTGLPDSVKLDPVTRLPDVSKIEDRLSNFFSNIETRLPKLTGNAKIEDREKSLCEVISIVNDLHTYMDQSLLPLKYAYNKVYRNDTMPVVEEKTEVRGPSGEVDVERCRTLPEVITACREQLTVIDALLQATELALQIEHKKNIFPDSDGCHIVYVEVWNETSRQEVRLQEIEKRRKDCK